MQLTVLYDAGCPLCCRFREWLAGQALLVPLELVPAGSTVARARYPRLDHASTLSEVTVVGDDGSIWTKENAWVMCLWATASYRGLAERLARPAWLPLARAAAYTAAGVRTLTRTSKGDDYIDACDGPCPPLAEG